MYEPEIIKKVLYFNWLNFNWFTFFAVNAILDKQAKNDRLKNGKAGRKHEFFE